MSDTNNLKIFEYELIFSIDELFEECDKNKPEQCFYIGELKQLDYNDNYKNRLIEDKDEFKKLFEQSYEQWINSFKDDEESGQDNEQNRRRKTYLESQLKIVKDLLEKNDEYVITNSFENIGEEFKPILDKKDNPREALIAIQKRIQKLLNPEMEEDAEMEEDDDDDDDDDDDNVRIPGETPGESPQPKESELEFDADDDEATKKTKEYLEKVFGEMTDEELKLNLQGFKEANVQADKSDVINKLPSSECVGYTNIDTSGDGNCLFHAFKISFNKQTGKVLEEVLNDKDKSFSLGLFNYRRNTDVLKEEVKEENLHIILRELATKHLGNDSNWNGVFSDGMTIRNYATGNALWLHYRDELYKNKKEDDAWDAFVVANGKNGVYTSLETILALSDIFDMNIKVCTSKDVQKVVETGKIFKNNDDEDRKFNNPTLVINNTGKDGTLGNHYEGMEQNKEGVAPALVPIGPGSEPRQDEENEVDTQAKAANAEAEVKALRTQVEEERKARADADAEAERKARADADAEAERKARADADAKAERNATEEQRRMSNASTESRKSSLSQEDIDKRNAEMDENIEKYYQEYKKTYDSIEDANKEKERLNEEISKKGEDRDTRAKITAIGRLIQYLEDKPELTHDELVEKYYQDYNKYITKASEATAKLLEIAQKEPIHKEAKRQALNRLNNKLIKDYEEEIKEFFNSEINNIDNIRRDFMHQQAKRDSQMKGGENNENLFSKAKNSLAELEELYKLNKKLHEMEPSIPLHEMDTGLKNALDQFNKKMSACPRVETEAAPEKVEEIKPDNNDAKDKWNEHLQEEKIEEAHAKQAEIKPGNDAKDKWNEHLQEENITKFYIEKLKQADPKNNEITEAKEEAKEDAEPVAEAKEKADAEPVALKAQVEAETKDNNIEDKEAETKDTETPKVWEATAEDEDAKKRAEREARGDQNIEIADAYESREQEPVTALLPTATGKVMSLADPLTLIGDNNTNMSGGELQKSREIDTTKLNEHLNVLKNKIKSTDSKKKQLFYAAAYELKRVNNIVMTYNLDIIVKILSLLSDNMYAEKWLSGKNNEKISKYYWNVMIGCIYIQINTNNEKDINYDYYINSIFGELDDSDDIEISIKQNIEMLKNRDTNYFKVLKKYYNESSVGLYENKEYMVSYVYFKFLYETFFKYANIDFNSKEIGDDSEPNHMGTSDEGKNYVSIIRFTKIIEEKTTILLKIISFLKNNNKITHINKDFKNFFMTHKKASSIVVRRHDNNKVDGGEHPLFDIKTVVDNDLNYASIKYLNDSKLIDKNPIYFQKKMLDEEKTKLETERTEIINKIKTYDGEDALLLKYYGYTINGFDEGGTDANGLEIEDGPKEKLNVLKEISNKKKTFKLIKDADIYFMAEKIKKEELQYLKPMMNNKTKQVTTYGHTFKTDDIKDWKMATYKKLFEKQITEFKEVAKKHNEDPGIKTDYPSRKNSIYYDVREKYFNEIGHMPDEQYIPNPKLKHNVKRIMFWNDFDNTQRVVTEEDWNEAIKTWKEYLQEENMVKIQEKINEYKKNYARLTHINYMLEVKLDENTFYIYNDDGEKVKFNNTTKNEQYILGPFDYIFNDVENQNKTIVEKVSKELNTDLITNQKDLMVIGYGQSGSGKTSTLIKFEAGDASEDGVLEEYLNLLQKGNKLKSVAVECVNLYIEPDGDKPSSYDNFDVLTQYKTEIYDWKQNQNVHEPGQTQQLLKGELKPKDSFIEKQTINSKDDVATVCKQILMLFDARQIASTPNNEKSSRSHIVVCLTLELNEGEPRKIVVCDLAGVENQFACENDEEIKRFDQQYNTLRSAGYPENPNKKVDQQALVAYKSMFTEDYFNDKSENFKNECKRDSVEDRRDKDGKGFEKQMKAYVNPQNKSILNMDPTISLKNFNEQVGAIYKKWLNDIIGYVNEQNKDIPNSIVALKKSILLYVNLVGLMYQGGIKENVDSIIVQLNSDDLDFVKDGNVIKYSTGTINENIELIEDIHKKYVILNEIINNEIFDKSFILNNTNNLVDEDEFYTRVNNEKYVDNILALNIKDIYIDGILPIIQDINNEETIQTQFKSIKGETGHLISPLAQIAYNKNSTPNPNKIFDDKIMEIKKGTVYNFNIILAIFKTIKENSSGKGIEVSPNLYLENNITTLEDMGISPPGISPQTDAPTGGAKKPVKKPAAKKVKKIYRMEDTIKDWKTKTFNLLKEKLSVSELDEKNNAYTYVTIGDTNKSKKYGSKGKTFENPVFKIERFKKHIEVILDKTDINTTDIEKRKTFPESNTCLDARIEKIRSDCVLRRQEGFMINRSLTELNNGMALISKEGVSSGSNLPIYFEKSIHPSCRKNALDYYTLDKYYMNTKEEDNWENDMKKYGVLITIVKRYFKLAENNFIDGFKLYTLLKVNTSFFSLPSQRYGDKMIEKVLVDKRTLDNTGKKNNPPNPPYVNVDSLKYISRIYDQDNKTRQNIINDFFGILKTYPFYKDLLISEDANIKNMKLINDPDFYNSKDFEQDVIPRLNLLIEFIERNNSSTLIGTYENTDMLQTISFNDVGCSDVYNVENYNNIVSEKVDELKYENLVNVANSLNNYLQKNEKILATDVIKKLQSNQNSKDENDKILYDIVTGEGNKAFKTFIDDNFGIVLKKSSKGGKKQKKNITNNTKKVLRNRKNRTLRNK